MKFLNFLITILVVISSIFRIDLGYGMNPKNKEVDLSKYELVWSDEFDGNELDHNKWNDNQNVNTLHWGAVRNGGYWHKDMIAVEDGALHIKTRYVDEEQAAKYGGDYKAGWYSGYVTTLDSNKDDSTNPDTFLYGYFECRCILPAGEGLWSAFWMMNGQVYDVNGNGIDGTEIDVFESFGYPDGEKKTADLISTNLHWDGYGEDHQHYSVGRFYANNPYEEYNTYGVEWTPDEYIFYINGHETARTSKGGVSQNPENLLLSVEVAGSNGVPSLSKGDITRNADNVDFIVDYVRVYQ